MGLFHQFRTVVFDRAIAAAAPLDQLVILGAGLDSRAWRLECLSDTTVFEVDHPSTQALKRAASAGIPNKAKEVRFVGSDFRAGTLPAVLAEAGFDASRRTFWLWEGVTMYLRPEEVARNVDTFSSLSTGGSRLALTYMSRKGRRIRRSLFLTLLGEPARSGYSPAEIAEMLRARGWEGQEDSGMEEWLAQMTPGLPLTRKQVGMQGFERIWCGEFRR
jgi:methyltransferase (TIGR00027 family)